MILSIVVVYLTDWVLKVVMISTILNKRSRDVDNYSQLPRNNPTIPLIPRRVPIGSTILPQINPGSKALSIKHGSNVFIPGDIRPVYTKSLTTD